jgi:glucokinase
MGAGAKKNCWVGFDLGGTKMLATVYDAKFKPLGSRRKKTKDYRGASNGVAGITKTIEDALQDAGVDRKRLMGIGIGCPGILDLDRGVLIHSPNLGWRNVPLKAKLEKAFKCPVVIGNDVDVGTYGEYRFGAAQGARCVVGVFVGTGVGGGCVYEGKIFRGRVGSCLEIGHIHLQPKGDLCGCGRHGCLETVASRLAISAEVAEAAYRGNAPHLFETAGTDLAAIRSRTLVTAIHEGDGAVEDIVRHSAKYLGVAMASIVNLLAPDVIVLGGGMVEAMPQLYLEHVRKAVREQAMKSLARGIRIVAARLGDDAGVMGAAALAAEAVHGRTR